MEYKIVAISDTWTSKKFSADATEAANKYAAEGWRLTKVKHGWLGFFSAKLFLVFERDTAAVSERVNDKVD